MKKIYTTHSREETQTLARNLGSKLTEGTTILLFGNLGAGKTTFVQGLARGLDINDRVNSPTFVIMKEYEGRIPLVHIDAYRLEGVNQDLGFDDYAENEVVKVIEWPEHYIENPVQHNRITINRLDENSRELIFEFNDEALIKDLNYD